MNAVKWIVLISVFGFVGCQTRPSAKLSPGRAYFEGFGCMRCHRIGDHGGTRGPDLTYVGFRKSREWIETWLKNPPAWKKDTIMPNFYFQASVRMELVEFLSSLKGEAFEETYYPWNKRELLDDPVRRGKVIFRRVGCVGCHGEGGVGGYPNNNVYGGRIPSLVYVADGYTKEELRNKICKGVQPNKVDPDGPDPLVFMPPWGEILQKNEIDAVVEYLFSLRPETSPDEDWD